MKVKLVIDFLADDSYEIIKYLVEYKKYNELDLEIHGYDTENKGTINQAYYGLYYSAKYGVSLTYTERVLKAHFVENKDIGNLEVLASCYEDIGFNRHDLIDAMMDGDYVDMFEYLQASLSKEGINSRCYAYIFTDKKELYVGKDEIIQAIKDNK